MSRALKTKFQKGLSIFLTLTIILWSMGLSFLAVPPQEAIAAANNAWVLAPTDYGADSTTHKASAVFATTQFSLSDKGEGAGAQDDTLQQVRFTVVAGSPAIVASEIAKVSVVKETGGGATTFDDGTDTVLASTTSITIGSLMSITVSDALTTTATSTYYVVAQIAASGLVDGHKFTVNMATSNLIVTGSAATTTALTGSKTRTVDISSPSINSVYYRNATTVDVIFSEQMATSTAQDANDYTLITAATGDNSTITSATLQPDSRTVRIVANAARISPSSSDTITVATGAGAPEDLAGNTQITGSATPPWMPYSDVLISEIRTAGAATTTDDFIEFYNKSGGAISLNGWRLAQVNLSGAETNLLNFGNVSIAAYGYYLAGNNSGYSGTSTVATNTGFSVDLPATGSSVVLYGSDGFIKDLVGYGTSAPFPLLKEGNTAVADPPAGGSLERKAVSSSTATTMAAGGTHVSWGNSYDSQTNNFDFIIQAIASPQNASSATETVSYTGAGAYTNQPPAIDHMPVIQSAINQPLNIFAQLMDAETPVDQLSAQIDYKVNSAAFTDRGDISGASISQGYFRFVIPLADLTATGTLDYYLSAGDQLFATTTLPTNATSGGSTFFRVNLVASAGTNTITGTVKDSADNNIAGATVFLMGTGISAVSAANGTFSLTNVFDGNYTIKVLAAGYQPSEIWGVSVAGGSTSANWTFNLASGSGGQGGQTGGGMGMIRFTAPSAGMMGAPISITPTSSSIMIGFSQEMATSTLTATNVLLKKIDMAGNATTVSVSLAYEPANQGVIIDSVSYEYGPDAKVILYSNTPLIVNTQYIVELTGAVTDAYGNALTGSRPGGGHMFMFNTGADMGTAGPGTNYGSGGAYMPPFVIGSTPTPGTMNVPQNAKLMVTFSEAMKSGSQPGSITATSSTQAVRLFNSAALEITLSLSLDTATSKVLTITPAANLTAGGYSLRVYGGGQNAAGISLGDTRQTNFESQVVYQADFTVGSTTDTTAPTIVGTNLEMYKSSGTCLVSSSGCVVNVPVNISSIEFGFSKDMNPSTINTNTVTLKTGTASVPGTVEYDSTSKSGRFIPSVALNISTNYTFTITGGSSGASDIIGGAGHYLAADYTVLLTTDAAADTTAPSIIFANADDYSLAITFSEAMKATASTDTNNWSRSVLNPANYHLMRDTGPPPSGLVYNYVTGTQNSTSTTFASSTGLTFKYDAMGMTVIVEGLTLPVTGGFRIWVNNVSDRSGNVISGSGTNFTASTFGANSAGGPVMSSASTFGMIGPGGGGTMAPPPTIGGSTMGAPPPAMGFGSYDPAMMGMRPVAVMPMNMLAGATSRYFVELPLTTALPAATGTATSSIVLTFPSGFDVSGAKSADPSNQYAHADINGPGTGTVKLLTSTTGGTHVDDGTYATSTKGGLANDGITINSSARTITIYIGNVATQAQDFLHLELDGIVNSVIPKGFDTAGYTVDIKTFNASRLLESKTSMPFFIQPRGVYIVSGTVTFPSAVTTTVDIFGGSPGTGPLNTNLTFNGTTTATYTFTGLNAGDVFLMTEPMKSIGTTDYFGASMPEPIMLSAANTANTLGGTAPCTSATACYYQKNFSFVASTGKPGLTVKIKGDFTTPSDVDVFFGGPSGFGVKTLTLNENYSTTPTSTTVSLPVPSTGIGPWNYMVGMGPAMPKGPMMSGPPKMPDWMPPKPIDIAVASSTNAWLWTDPDTDGAGTNDASANNGQIVFEILTASRTIAGHVYDTSNTAISNAEVYAYSPLGGFGTRAQTKDDGAFTLKVTDGTYKIGSFSPGMPPSQEVAVDVINGTVFVNNATTTDVIIKVQKSGVTISGNVSAVSGTTKNPVKDAGIYAYRSDGPGHAEARTNSSGNYTLYLFNGTWNIGAFAPKYGQLPEITGVVVSGSSVPNKNFEIGGGTVNYSKTITGRIYKDQNGNATYDSGEELTNVLVRATGAAGVNVSKTDSSGNYTLTVPDDTASAADAIYTVQAYAPGIGALPPLTNIDVNSASQANKNISTAATQSVTLNIQDSAGTPVDKGLIDFQSTSSSLSSDTVIESATSTYLTMPNGTYKLNLDIPGVKPSDITIAGADYNAAQGTVVVNATETITVTLPTMRTVSGTVTDDTGAAVANAIVHIEDPLAGVSIDAAANASGTYSVKMPNGSYVVQADKANHIDTAEGLSVSGNTTKNLVVTKATYTISGQVTVSASGINKARVWAKKLGEGFVSTEANDSGSYTLNVTAGDWKVFASADKYQEKQYSTVVSIINVNASGIDISLSATQSTSGSKQELVTPASGGLVADTSSNIKIFIPPNAIDTSTSDYQLKQKETSNIANVPGESGVSGKGIDVRIYDANGTPITTLNSDIFVEKTYTKAALASDGRATKTAVDKMKMGYWDDTAQNWVNVPTVVNYFDSLGVLVTSPLSDLSDVSTVAVKGIYDHLTVYSPTSPTNVDGSTPSAPTGLTATAGNSRATLTWTAPSTNILGSALTDLLGYEVYRASSASGPWSQVNTSDITPSAASCTGADTSCSWADTTAVNDAVYYYKVTAADTFVGSGSGNESDMSGASNAVTPRSVANDTGTPGGGGGAAGGAVSGTPTTSGGALQEGSLVKASGDAKIYIIKAGKKLLIPSAKAFEDSGYKWSQVKEVPASDIAAAASVALVKSTTDNKVYVVKQGKRLWIPSASAFENAGYKWTDIASVASASRDAYPETTLIKTASDAKVYKVVGAKRIWIPSAEIFGASGYKWTDIVNVASNEMSAFGETQLVKAIGDNKVYKIEDGKKQWIPSVSKFTSLGFDWANIAELGSKELNSYSTGTNL